MPAKKMRDVTRALEIAKIVRDHAGDDYSPDLNNELVEILDTLDARTGRRDPSKRGKAPVPQTGPSSATAQRRGVRKPR